MGRELRLCRTCVIAPRTEQAANHAQNSPTGIAPTSQPAIPKKFERKYPKPSRPADKTMKNKSSIKVTTVGSKITTATEVSSLVYERFVPYSEVIPVWSCSAVAHASHAMEKIARSASCNHSGSRLKALSTASEIDSILCQIVSTLGMTSVYAVPGGLSPIRK